MSMRIVVKIKGLTQVMTGANTNAKLRQYLLNFGQLYTDRKDSYSDYDWSKLKGDCVCRIFVTPTPIVGVWG